MWHGHWCFGFIFFFIFLFIILRVVAFRRFGGCHRGWYDEAEVLLRKRLVNGEITEEEYQRLKDALKK
jgi:uncharacterized membrane protein